ncbi:MAG: 23S rRNA (uracil(1939)-C(5))-methyltransferase RlmD [Clostridia bacterium]|nr:23S rRNA (uracil(1939)-C(5))-methyltransferase RlmD [Clostridia bacterium]
MEKNDILTLTCEGLGADMEGVCRHEGMAVFVPGMLPGETGRVRVVKVQPRFAFGRMEGAPEQPSPHRRTPDCPAYPRCGGCSCRHMDYETTLAAKRRQVEDCFRRIGHLSVEAAPVIGMAEPSRYRNKTALPVGGTAEAPVIGFYAPRSHTIISAADCPNAMPPAPDIAEALMAWMRRFRIEPYREEEKKGLVRHLVVRVNRAGEALACVVANGPRLPHEEALAEALRAAGAAGVVLNENTRPDNVILGDRFRTLWGRDRLTDTLCGLSFSVSPAAFFQVNPVQTEVLYQTALDFAALRPEDTACDVYCGAGTITLLLARHCRSAIGIEVVPQAIDNARENARTNGIGNADFRVGAAETVLLALVAEGLRPDVITVDPPRKGLDPAVIAAIHEAAPRRVVYVSCNPATLARDAALLAEKGWQVEKVQPVDMFCWTSGVETVISLSQQRPDHYVRVGIDLDDMDVTPAESKASYQEIKDYVLAHTGLKVSCLYIAQVKAKHGIIERECYNKAKTEGNRVPKCPPEKEKAIEEALRHFQMIPSREPV